MEKPIGFGKVFWWVVLVSMVSAVIHNFDLVWGVRGCVGHGLSRLLGVNECGFS